MAITFTLDEDGERVALVDTIDDFDEAINTLDCPILAPPEIAEAFGLPDYHPIDSAEWHDACQFKEDRWTSIGDDREH